jgi:hypothetical protein
LIIVARSLAEFADRPGAFNQRPWADRAFMFHTRHVILAAPERRVSQSFGVARGGDAWDAAIRRQIKTCALVIPVLSANTQGISDIKKWMHPSADLADFEPLYDGLRLAGVGN